MEKNSQIDIRGEWACGEGLKITLTADMLPAVDVVNRIETKIRSLRSLYFEVVIVELQDENTVDSDHPIYFQMLRNRDFGQTDTYRIELGMTIDCGIIHYIKDKASLFEALDVFRKICVNREKPKPSEWRIGNRNYGAKETLKERKEKLQVKRCKDFLSRYWRHCLDGYGVEFAEYEAWEYVAENDNDPHFSCELAREYERRGLYTKVHRLFKTHSHNPVVAQINGEMALHGVFGKPDYKIAYEYFLHAMTIGSLLAEYYIAKMYRHGLYVKKDYDEYERRIRAVYQKYQDGIIECCPDRIFLEMSKIEQRAGNDDAAIEYCLRPLKISKKLMRTGYGMITEGDSEFVNRLYELIEFDPDDMDLLDLLYVLRQPCKVHFCIGNKQFTVQALKNNGRLIVKCGKAYYRDAVDLLQKHKIKDWHLAAYLDDISYMEIV